MSEKYHFIGIGGAGMSALARMLARQGESVSGSEMADSPTRRALERELGIAIPVGQRPENLDDASMVVFSAAIKSDNPELVAARDRGLVVVSRAEMLGRVMDRYETRIAVGGTHGKTTTSAMLATVLERAGLDPTALIGGDLTAWNSNARVGGAGGPFVAEACEAYGSFLEIRPTISVVTNVEADHLDYYGSLERVVEAFEVFAGRTTRLLVLWADDSQTACLSAAAECRVVTFGVGGTAGLRAVPEDGAKCGYAVYQGSDKLGKLQLAAPGRHNLLNALAAAVVGLELGLAWPAIADGLAAFAGTGRRFERLGETDCGIVVVDDYAHHPTELRATLAAARQAYPGRRIVAVFQPHLPSRTRDLMEEFANAFADADLVVLTDIYLAREPADPSVTGEHLARKVAASIGGDRVRYVAEMSQLPVRLADWVLPNDLLLTLGAGDIRAAGEGFLALKRDGLGTSRGQTRSG